MSIKIGMRKMVGLLAVLAWMLPATPLLAAGVEVLDPWVREGPPSMQVLAGYMVIRNTGHVGKTLVGASSPLFAKVEFHETLHQGHMATMVSRDSLVIDAGSQVQLKPNGYHMMLIAPQGPKPLRAGDKVPLALNFSDGSQLAFQAVVRRGAQPGKMTHPAGHMHH